MDEKILDESIQKVMDEYEADPVAFMDKAVDPFWENLFNDPCLDLDGDLTEDEREDWLRDA